MSKLFRERERGLRPFNKRARMKAGEATKAAAHLRPLAGRAGGQAWIGAAAAAAVASMRYRKSGRALAGRARALLPALPSSVRRRRRPSVEFKESKVSER